MTAPGGRFYVDAWDPSYGASFEATATGPAAPSSAQVETDAELPAVDWRAIDVRAGVRAPDVVLLVDGVRRIDASIWTAEEDGGSFPGLAASYAAGVVRCDLERGSAQLAGTRVGRGLFTASPSARDVVAGSVRYPVHRVGGTGELAKLPAAVQGPLTALEVAVSDAVRTDGDLLVVDGPLRSRRNLPRTLGYIKTQHSQYLDARLTAVVTGLAAGQRSPVFRVGTAWGGWSWYLRLPVSAGAPWAGIVRVECSPTSTSPRRSSWPTSPGHPPPLRLHPVQGPACPAEPHPDRGPRTAAARAARRRPAAAPRADGRARAGTARR